MIEAPAGAFFYVA